MAAASTPRPTRSPNITAANPDLKPEKSTSYTLGAVWAPTRSFSVSLDYYHIKKNDVIAQGQLG
ncbi:TonB-dependent receptor domain-containing protein [Caulobacter segnis]